MMVGMFPNRPAGFTNRSHRFDRKAGTDHFHEPARLGLLLPFRPGGLTLLAALSLHQPPLETVGHGRSHQPFAKLRPNAAALHLLEDVPMFAVMDHQDRAFADVLALDRTGFAQVGDVLCGAHQSSAMLSAVFAPADVQLGFIQTGSVFPPSRGAQPFLQENFGRPRPRRHPQPAQPNH